MSKSSLLYRKFIGTASLKVISRLLTMVTGIIFARYLGPEQFGLYSLTLAIITLATVPIIAGLPALLIREIANYQLEKKWALLNGIINWSRIYVLSLSMIIVLMIYVGMRLELFDESISNLLWIGVLLVPLRGGVTQQGAILNGFGKPIQAQLPTQLLIPTITLIIVAIYIVLKINFSGSDVINISILACFLSLVISEFLLKNTMGSIPKRCVPKYTIKKWHTSLLPFTFITFLGTLNTELASVLLGWLVDAESVAYYKVAMQAITLISIGLTSINAVIMPKIARLYTCGDLGGTQLLLTKSVRLSAVISFPIIIFLIVFGKIAIEILFGEGYLESYPILIVLCFGQVFNVLMGSVGLVLGMTGNENRTLKVLLLSFLLNVALLITLIPLYGNIGAAIANSLTMVCWNVLMTVDVWKKLKLKTWLM